MPRDWENTFRGWAQGPAKTEQERIENAERMVRGAIRASPSLGRRNIEVFAQGSYRNRTNVRQDSDVDICVRLMDVFYTSHPFDPYLTDGDMGVCTVPSIYTPAQFKNDVEQALRDHFGRAGVTRGDKAIDVHANTYRVDADVVPAFEHRRYQRSSDGTVAYHSGTEIHPDAGGRIINWPHQHYDEGVAKNSRTGRRFKAIVRVLKRLHNEMLEYGGREIPSFLIECLVWNVPDYVFTTEGYVDTVEGVLAHIAVETVDDSKCSEWAEVNDLKYLFRAGQPWTREAAQTWVQQAWSYLRIGGAF